MSLRTMFCSKAISCFKSRLERRSCCTRVSESVNASFKAKYFSTGIEPSIEESTGISGEVGEGEGDGEGEGVSEGEGEDEVMVKMME